MSTTASASASTAAQKSKSPRSGAPKLAGLVSAIIDTKANTKVVSSMAETLERTLSQEAAALGDKEKQQHEAEEKRDKDERPTIPVFSAALEEALKEVSPSTDSLDDPKFDPIAYINSVFPDEKSLSGVKHVRRSSVAAPANPDGTPSTAAPMVITEIEELTLETFLNSLYRRIVYLKDDISKSVKAHSTQRGQTRQSIAEAKAAIQELFQKVKAIKEKAKKSEDMVQEICRDIKSLDYAKKHITNTITALRRLHMLMSAVDQLVFMTKSKQYKEAAKLFEAITMLFHYFKAYDNIPHIKSLSYKVQENRDELKMLIFKEFREYGFEAGVGATPEQAKILSDACMLVDVLGDEIKAALLDWFLTHSLDGYRMMFGPNKEAWPLDQAERRYAWLKRQLLSYSDRFEQIFPKQWHVPCMIARDFCRLTRVHFNKMFSGDKGTNAGPEADVNLIIKILQKTIEFEKEMAAKFRASLKEEDPKKKEETKAPASSQSQKTDKDSKLSILDMTFRFEGLISEVFFPQLGGYVDLERSNIRELMDKLYKEEDWTIPESVAKARFKGSDEFFVYIKKSMTRATKLNTGQILYRICLEYQRGIQVYLEMMESKIPRKAESACDLNLGEIRTVSLIVNTCEYFIETLPSLQETINKTLDPQYNNVNLEPQVEAFNVLATKAVSALANSMMCRANRILAGMTRLPWGNWPNVGDSSEYVNQLNAILMDDLPHLATMLSNTYHNFYCTQVANRLIPAFEDAIFKCRRVSDLGAQQLSLDAHALKGILLEMPNIGVDEEAKASGKGPSRSFTRYVTKEMGRVEAILKTLITPPDRLIATFRALLPKDAKSTSAAEQIVKIMDLRGLTKKDQMALIDAYNNSEACNANPSERISAPPGSTFRSFFRLP